MNSYHIQKFNTARNEEILRRKKAGESYQSIAVDMNVSKQRIGQIVKCGLSPSGAPPFGKAKGVTPREREVALLVERKLSNDEIAHRLGIKLSTVKTHVRNIFAKRGPGPRRSSNGATTAAGIERIREAQRQRWQRYRAAHDNLFEGRAYNSPDDGGGHDD